MKYPLFYILLALILVQSTACGHRAPSSSAAATRIEHYLERYAKKFPDSEVAKDPVTKIDVSSVTIIKKGVVDADTFLTTQSGALVPTSFSLMRKPLGWTVRSWEIRSN